VKNLSTLTNAMIDPTKFEKFGYQKGLGRSVVSPCQRIGERALACPANASVTIEAIDL
jgi:hypothetical protein